MKNGIIFLIFIKNKVVYICNNETFYLRHSEIFRVFECKIWQTNITH